MKHLVETVMEASLESFLNMQSALGWELVAVYRPHNAHEQRLACVFRRHGNLPEKQEENKSSRIELIN